MRDGLDSAMRRRPGGLLAAGALIAGSLVGCSGGSGDPDSLRRLLDRMPDTAAARQLTEYGNVARLRGEDPPAKPQDDAVRFLDEFGGIPLGWPFMSVIDEAFAEEAGFDLTDVDASLTAEVPPNRTTVVAGRFDPERVGRVLTEPAPFADQVDAGEAGGVDTYAVGEDGQSDLERVSLLRPNGRSLRIGVTEDLVRFASTTDAFDRLLQVADGSSDSLGADATYQWAADLIDEAEAHAAALMGKPELYRFDPASAGSPAQTEAVQEMIDSGEMGLVRWEFAAVADTPGELMILLVHADNEAARQNAERLRKAVEQGRSMVTDRPWSSLLEVNSIETDGERVVARLAAERPLAFSLLTARDPLILIVDG